MGERVFIAGSTQEPEEEVALSAWESLREEFPSLRLILVPRHAERFEAVARLVQQRGHRLLRRSTTLKCEVPAVLSSPAAERLISRPAGGTEDLNQRLSEGSEAAQDRQSTTAVVTPEEGMLPVVLLDTLGELCDCWGLAEIAFVGGSLGRHRGGQNMLEPAAYGATVLFGPHTDNFQSIVEPLLAAGGAVVVKDAAALRGTLQELLRHPEQARTLGEAARGFVLSQQGATSRTVDLLLTEVAGVAASMDV